MSGSSRGGGVPGQPEGEQRPAARGVVGGGVAAMLGGDAGHDGQAEPRTPCRPGPGRPARTGRTRGPAPRRRGPGRGRGPPPRPVGRRGGRRPRSACRRGVWRKALVTRLAIACRRWSGSPRTIDGPGSVERDRPIGGGRHGIAAGVGGEHGEVDRHPFERSGLVEPGQEEQVLDQGLHPGRLLLDAAHDDRQVDRRPASPVEAAPSRNSSAKPWIEVSGVRSSWEASARNWRSRCSVASRSAKADSISLEHGVEGQARAGRPRCGRRWDSPARTGRRR